MTVELLIHAIVRQTTILIAQLATSRGLRAPLAQVADQVFVDLVRELERQGVSRKVGADMFGLGLRTYRRKIQRLSESSTERGRSLWEIVLEFLRERGIVSRQDVLARFSGDDEAQVRAVLYDLCESELVFSSGSATRTSYRAASQEELTSLQRSRGSEGEDELLIALLYQEGLLGLTEIVDLVQADSADTEACLERLLAAGRIECVMDQGQARYRARALVIPLGAEIGWEAAVLDHFRALVTTVLSRLRDNRSATLGEQVGGSTYTIDVWPGHPMEGEVLTSLGRMRSALSDLRARVMEFNVNEALPERHTRAVIYVGQTLIQEGLEDVE